MRTRSDPWKWPFAVGLALVLTGGLFLFLPESWLDGLLPDPSLSPGGREQPPRPWLVLSPPPLITAEPRPEKKPEPEKKLDPVPRQDPRWWSEGWRIKTELAVVQDLASVQADSVTLLLSELGVGIDFLQQTRPDSLLASRLFLLQMEDSLRFDELKPYLSAMTRSRAYADIMSRAADMYDDFLQSSIMTPD
jgi:hypothetical protein